MWFTLDILKFQQNCFHDVYIELLINSAYYELKYYPINREWMFNPDDISFHLVHLYNYFMSGQGTEERLKLLKTFLLENSKYYNYLYSKNKLRVTGLMRNCFPFIQHFYRNLKCLLEVEYIKYLFPVCCYISSAFWKWIPGRKVSERCHEQNRRMQWLRVRAIPAWRCWKTECLEDESFQKYIFSPTRLHDPKVSCVRWFHEKSGGDEHSAHRMLDEEKDSQC